MKSYPSAQSSCQSGNFNTSLQTTLEKQKLKFSRSVLFHMKTRISLKHFVNDCGLIRICCIRWWCSLFTSLAANTFYFFCPKSKMELLIWTNSNGDINLFCFTAEKVSFGKNDHKLSNLFLFKLFDLNKASFGFKKLLNGRGALVPTISWSKTVFSS